MVMTKRVIEFTILMEVDVPSELDEDQAMLYLEKNRCSGNYGDELSMEAESEPGSCEYCPRSSIRLLPVGACKQRMEPRPWV